MKDLTVKQLAAISGVTVRTLHHYDEIGLLSPAYVGSNGYRYYGRKELLRLQQILFHREFGVPLNEIAELLEMDAADQVGVLLRHREKLETATKRYAELMTPSTGRSPELKDKATWITQISTRALPPRSRPNTKPG